MTEKTQDTDSKKSKTSFKPFKQSNGGFNFNNMKRNNFNLNKKHPVVRRSGRG